VAVAAIGLVAALFAGDALAQAAAPPPLTLNIVETADFWRNTQGGFRVGDATLNKLQVSVTFDGERAGAPGLRAYAQVFKTDGESLSGGRVGDIQTASTIEAISAIRLMEAWAEHDLGSRLIARAGLIDLNRDFDSAAAAGLFLNSSHGIGPDISQTGANGPSIFPDSSLALEAFWTPTPTLTLKAGLFDGVPGDPAHPRRFVSVKLSARDGALLIAQADFRPAPDTVLSLAVWGYTADFDRIEPGLPPQHGQGGAYALAQTKLAAGWSAWLRAGVADGGVNPIAGYLGGGIVRTGVFGRGDDQAGVAVAHAVLGDPIRRRDGLAAAETSIEATYLFQATPVIALQPDVQYIIHPASRPRLPKALSVALRVIIALKLPSNSPSDFD
jgi:porin